MMKQSICETLSTPVVKEADVVVVGSGSAGWTAAVAAARNGAKTILIEKNYEVGGTSTTAMMHLFGAPLESSHGLMREVMERLQATGGIKVGPLSPYDGCAYAQLVLDILVENNVELLLGVTFAKTIVEGNVVKGVIIETKSGRQAIQAGMVIDATGDGDVCASAGADFVLGRARDNKMRPITLLFRIGNIDSEKLLAWAKEHPEEFKKDENSHIMNDEKSIYRLHGFFQLAQKGRDAGKLDKDCHYIRFEYLWKERGIALINSTRVYCINALKPEELTRGIIEAREQIKKLFDFIRSNVPGCENGYIIDISQMPGIRETRHIVGEHLLTEEELIEGLVFTDRLFRDFRRVTPGAEVHSPDGNEGGAGDTLEREGMRKLMTFTLPLGSFIPKGLENILVAGRCISATHQADGWTRDQPGCVLMGQTVGIVASEAVKQKCSVRSLNIADLQDKIRATGVLVD